MKLLFERGAATRCGVELPRLDVEDVGHSVPDSHLRSDIPLPELSEVDVVRHYTELSCRNFSIDKGFYPLGSCTMKYNPKANEVAASLPGFAFSHPYQPDSTVQGNLSLMYSLEQYLCMITGMDAFTLQPAAGAHGELTALMMVKAFFADKGETRTNVIIPDSAHGTNPASAAMCGFTPIEVKSGDNGLMDIPELENVLDKDTAAVMLTNPNTLGLFEDNILDICKMVHDAGAKMYMDGANMNALLGVARPRDMGFDLIHLNLHKTFSTPHGGGGPGSGPVGVTKELEPFLPSPTVKCDGESFSFDTDRPKAIGKVVSFNGNFLVLARAYSYILALGRDNIRKVSENAVLNANYLMHKLKGHYDLPHDRRCMHEFILAGTRWLDKGVHTMDIAKRLIDHGVHPPTVYFPLIVAEALMIEPTETESKETMDEFVEAMITIAKEAAENPDIVKSAPHSLPIGRLDGVLAARKPDVVWRPE